VLVTMQQAAMHHRALTANSAPAELLATFHTPFFLGAAIALIGVIAAATIRDFDRSDTSLKA
jgi:hypothetical protein